jgi:hypothetical protein
LIHTLLTYWESLLITVNTKTLIWVMCPAPGRSSVCLARKSATNPECRGYEARATRIDGRRI